MFCLYDAKLILCKIKLQAMNSLVYQDDLKPSGQ